MRWQSADGRVLEGWAGGDPGGPLVAVLHGCPDTRHVAMTGHDAARAVGVRLLCVNRPGYGGSTAHASTLGSVADDLSPRAGWACSRRPMLPMSPGSGRQRPRRRCARRWHSPTATSATPPCCTARGSTCRGRSGARCPVRAWFGEDDDRSGADAADLVRGFADVEVVVRQRTTHLATLVAHWPEMLATLRDLV